VAQFSAKPVFALHGAAIEYDAAAIAGPMMVETDVSRLFAPKMV